MTDLSGDTLNVIRESIRLETNGRAFFEHAANVTHNELGKKMFNKLAQDEIGHLHTFGQLFTSVIGSEDWKKYVKEEELRGASSVIEDLEARIAKEKKENRSGELEAIRIGMSLERNAIEFFEASAKQTSDKNTQAIFNKICDEERLHYDLLQAQLDNVTNAGFWFDIAEFRMDGKY